MKNGIKCSVSQAVLELLIKTISCMFWPVRDHSQTLVRRGGPDAKRGALKIFDPCKGGPEKNYHRFSIKIEFTCFSMGLTHNFHGKKGGPEIFFAVWRGPQKICAINIFLHQASPYKCLWTVPNSRIRWHTEIVMTFWVSQTLCFRILYKFSKSVDNF